MIYPKIPLAQSIIEICRLKNVRHIVISPGSRNAPLTIGFVNNPFFKCYSIADERCAAFFALGIAQQLKEPVAVVCTSGSALLNFYPAFAEAFYSQIPLIVISADRPSDKIDIGDGQTIRQKNVFANHSVYNANLTEDASFSNDEKINDAINYAISKKGPTHINAPFEEPLYQTVETLSVNPIISDLNNRSYTIPADKMSEAGKKWNSAKKKLILIGVNEANSISEKVIESWVADTSILVMTEVTSNLHHPSFITNIDTIITPFEDQDFRNLQPELLVTFGGMIVSKRVKSFLRQYRPKQHWHIDPLRAYDTFGCLTHHFETTAEEFFLNLAQNAQPVESTYWPDANQIRNLRERKHGEYLANIPFSDFKVFERLIPSLPKNSLLQISNSASIRYAQLFEVDKSIEVFCNRGTSGIDGSTSTAIGAASASEKGTVLITGDVGFLYDSNALWNNYIPKNFKIILLNNGGGGIFRILPGHSENEVFNTYFETSHCLTAEHLAKMYRFNYLTANDEETLAENLRQLHNDDNNPVILEIFTPTHLNDKILLNYFRQLK
ncbi:MAG TPA: 2-succinyl-5-enolpyruvyl-6-hydroxy-3-cyclohexene-1-carboxylic-acid synthase [Flavobacterium sp.]|jgi:2-succinyl-5-enolpyruvyl-6-hydroxy-3-cyclohexene-1-carboxylate synthase